MKSEIKNPLICDPETGVCEIPNQQTSSSQNVQFTDDGKPIRVIYYTDPICSSCWGIEPQLRKLKLEYGQLLNFEYKMGGLLPDWEYNSGGISKPSDVAHHWDEVSQHYQMPIDGDVWLEDPLHSSYPPSIAVKAAQMQGQNKAVDFLRSLREKLFLEKRNITKWEHLRKAADATGLDVLKLKEDYTNGRAETLFREDLAFGQQLGVRGFPSIYFLDYKEKQQFVYGSHPYSYYEGALQTMLPNAQKQRYDKGWENLFAHYPSLTVKEFAVLADVDFESAEQQMESLYQQGKLNKTVTKNGNLYNIAVGWSATR